MTRLRRAAPAEVYVPPLDQTLTYETFYGLDEKPFSLSSDPKFLYHSTSHDNVAQELLSAIRNREGAVVITGEPGIGKTMLCRAVTEQLDRRTLASFAANPTVSIEELIKTILLDFGVISRDDLAGGRLARASRQDMTLALREFLQTLAPLQAFAVVLIDEAQKLPADLLEQIWRLSNVDGDERLLQVVLVGQPSLVKLLRRSELRPLAQQVSVRCQLGPLDDDEVPGYVTHRLAVAGGNPRVEFDEDAFRKLFELSAGVPRVINVLCDRALTLGYGVSASLVDAALVGRAADDLDIQAPRRGPSLVTRIALGTVLAMLVLVGAGAAAFVFHERFLQMIAQWEAIPSAPRAPVLGRPAPFTPPSPPPDPPDRPPPRL